MKYIRQFGIIVWITFLAEGMKWALPFPFPASIYGLLLMFFLLYFRIIRLEAVKETGKFLMDIMPLMFIPAGVGLITSWDTLKPALLPISIITVFTTVFVMAITGMVTQTIIRHETRKQEKNR